MKQLLLVQWCVRMGVQACRIKTLYIIVLLINYYFISLIYFIALFNIFTSDKATIFHTVGTSLRVPHTRWFFLSCTDGLIHQSKNTATVMNWASQTGASIFSPLLFLEDFSVNWRESDRLMGKWHVMFELDWVWHVFVDVDLRSMSAYMITWK